MKPSQHIYEIGYAPSFELIDHSEVFLNDVPGTPHFATLMAKWEENLKVNMPWSIDLNQKLAAVLLKLKENFEARKAAESLRKDAHKHEAQEMIVLFSRIKEWVTQMAADHTFRIGDTSFQVAW